MKIIEKVKKFFSNDPDYSSKPVTEEERKEVITRLGIEICRANNN